MDISQSRVDFAKTFSADDVFVPPPKPADVGDEEWSARVAEIIKGSFNLGEGADVVLEATGAQACIQTGIHLTKKGGTYVQAGMGREVSNALYVFVFHALIFRGSRLTNCSQYEECCLSYRNSLHSRFDHPWVYSLQHWLRLNGSGLDCQCEGGRKASYYQ